MICNCSVNKTPADVDEWRARVQCDIVGRTRKRSATWMTSVYKSFSLSEGDSMVVRAERVMTMKGVPKDRNSIIVQAKVANDELSVQIQYRQAVRDGRSIDRVLHEKCPMKDKTAMRLATDLALIAECEHVYVLGDIVIDPNLRGR